MRVGIAGTQIDWNELAWKAPEGTLVKVVEFDTPAAGSRDVLVYDFEEMCDYWVKSEELQGL